jgi:Protein of unknown function (DUF1573)
VDSLHGLAKSSLMQRTVDAVPLRQGANARTWEVTSHLRISWSILKRYLDLGLGTVLVLAGALKGQLLLVDPSLAQVSGFPRELLIVASAFELGFGVWLLAGLYRCLTRWVALAWFTILAVVALMQAVSGAASCACLGGLHTSPWLMFSFDVAVIAALWMWSPKEKTCRRQLLPVLCQSLLPMVALVALAGIPENQTTFVEVDLGDMAQGEQREHAFQCSNNSGMLAEVTTIETSCPCTSLHLERTGVRAGQYHEGSVRLDLRRKPEFA